MLLLRLRLRSDRYRHTPRPHLPERGHNKTKAQKTRRAAATGGPWAGLGDRNEDHMICNHTGQKAGRSRRGSRLMRGSTRRVPDKAVSGDSLVLRRTKGEENHPSSSVGSPGLRSQKKVAGRRRWLRAGPPSDAGIRASFRSVSPRLLSTVDAGEGSRRSRGGRRAATGM